MKKITVRALSLLLILLLTLSLFIACDSGKEEGTESNKAESAEGTKSENANGTEETIVSGSETETETVAKDVHPYIEKKDYADDFHMIAMSASNQLRYHWVEESNNDAMSEALFARQEKVREYLGVEITGADATGDHTSYTEPFKTSVKNKDDSIQLMLSHVHSGIVSMIQGNYLLDFSEADHFNIEADYWNYEFMEGLSVADHMYLGRNDFNILYTYVISFNKDMLEKYADALDDSIYNIVNDYKWTIDKMMSLASLAYIDKNADGKTEDDTFGITGVQWVPYIGFLHASGLKYIDIDEAGQYEIAVYNEVNQARTATLIDKLSALAAADYSWFRYRIESTPLVPLTSGRALMQLTNTYDLPSFCDFEINFGILPYPLFDENQADIGYRHLQWGGYLCMPSYTANQQMSAETLEALAYFSTDVNITFYEKLLGKQVADAPDDKKMLDLVWDTICPEFAQAYDDVSGGWLYMIPELTWVNTTQNLASYVRSRENSAKKTLNKFLTLVIKMNERNN